MKDKDAKLWVYGQKVYDCQVADSTLSYFLRISAGLSTGAFLYYLHKETVEKAMERGYWHQAPRKGVK